MQLELNILGYNPGIWKLCLVDPSGFYSWGCLGGFNTLYAEIKKKTKENSRFRGNILWSPLSGVYQMPPENKFIKSLKWHCVIAMRFCRCRYVYFTTTEDSNYEYHMCKTLCDGSCGSIYWFKELYWQQSLLKKPKIVINWFPLRKLRFPIIIFCWLLWYSNFTICFLWPSLSFVYTSKLRSSGLAASWTCSSWSGWTLIGPSVWGGLTSFGIRQSPGWISSTR